MDPDINATLPFSRSLHSRRTNQQASIFDCSSTSLGGAMPKCVKTSQSSGLTSR